MVNSLLKIYPFIWPVIFVCGGIYALSTSHAHFALLGLNVELHDLMWFLMAFAHAEVFWRRKIKVAEATES